MKVSGIITYILKIMGFDLKKIRSSQGTRGQAVVMVKMILFRIFRFLVEMKPYVLRSQIRFWIFPKIRNLRHSLVITTLILPCTEWAQRGFVTLSVDLANFFLTVSSHDIFFFSIQLYWTYTRTVGIRKKTICKKTKTTTWSWKNLT